MNINLLNPIATTNDLPIDNNIHGDLVLCLKNKIIYIWDEPSLDWKIYSENNDNLVGTYSYLITDINQTRISTNINSNYLTNNTYLNESKLGPKDYSLTRENNIIVLTLTLSYKLDIGDRILIEYFKSEKENPEEPEGPDNQEDPEIGDIIRKNHTHDDSYLKLNKKEIKFKNENYIGYDVENNKIYIKRGEKKDYIYTTNNKPTLEELGYVKSSIDQNLDSQINYSPSTQDHNNFNIGSEKDKVVSAYTMNSFNNEVNEIIENSLVIEKDFNINNYNNPFKAELWQELNKMSDFKINSEKETEIILKTKKKYIKPSDNTKFIYIPPISKRGLEEDADGYILIEKLEFDYRGLIKLSCEPSENNAINEFIIYQRDDIMLNKLLKTATIGEFIVNQKNSDLSFKHSQNTLIFDSYENINLFEVRPGDVIYIFVKEENVNNKDFNTFKVSYDIFEK